MLIEILVKWIGIYGIFFAVLGVIRYLLTLKSEPDDSEKLRWKLELAGGIVSFCLSLIIKNNI